MSQDPPRRKPSGAVIDRVEAGAIHTLRPIVPVSERPTLPPPIPPDPKPLPVARPVPRVPTTLGMPAMRPKLDSYEVANATLLDELAAKSREARAAETEAARLRLELEAAKRTPVEPAVPLDVPTRWQVAALLYKLGGAMVAILVPCGVYLAYRVESLAPRVSTTETKQQTQQRTTVTVEDRLRALEQYNRALVKRDDCLDAERDSAIERGTGHTVEAGHDNVQWFEQSRPVAKPRILWETSPWYVTTPCPPKPYPPGDP